MVTGLPGQRGHSVQKPAVEVFSQDQELATVLLQILKGKIAKGREMRQHLVLRRNVRVIVPNISCTSIFIF